MKDKVELLAPAGDMEKLKAWKVDPSDESWMNK